MLETKERVSAASDSLDINLSLLRGSCPRRRGQTRHRLTSSNEKPSSYKAADAINSWKRILRDTDVTTVTMTGVQFTIRKNTLTVFPCPKELRLKSVAATVEGKSFLIQTARNRLLSFMTDSEMS